MTGRAEPARDDSGTMVAVLALAPLVGLALPFRIGLWAQGGAILAALALRMAPRLAGVPAALAAAPLPLRIGLGLYTAAALWGGAVGLVAGHPLPVVVGQIASMMLFPAGFAAFAAAPRPTPQALVGGLAAALGVALALHLAVWLGLSGLAAPPGEAVRLVFRNDIGYGGLAVVVAGLALAWLSGGGGAPAMASLAAAAVVVVGAMSRGGWAAAAVGTSMVLALTGRDGRRSRLTLIALAACALATAAAVLALGARAGETIAVVTGYRVVQPAQAVAGPAAAATVSPQSGPLVLLCPLPAGSRGLEVAASVAGDASIEASLLVTPLAGDAAGSDIVIRFSGGAGERWGHLLRLPEGTTGVRLTVHCDRGTLRVEELTLRPLQGSAATWQRAVYRRVVSLATAAAAPQADGTLDYRMHEWHAVRAAWSSAGAGRLLAGHGLGAQFDFPNSSWDADGQRVQLPTASYIHNWYVFLGFKLGLAGVAALAGVLAIAGWSWSRALALRGDPARGWPAAAAAAVWVGLLVWSVSSPCILDFRLAPILGALVAMTCADAGPPEALAAGAEA
jgi:hypothetical protein